MIHHEELYSESSEELRMDYGGGGGAEQAGFPMSRQKNSKKKKLIDTFTVKQSCNLPTNRGPLEM